MSKKTQTVIDLVRVKSWYMPRDAVAYQVLAEVAGPLLIFHKDFLPTLQLATRRKGIRAREVLWTDIYNELVDDIGTRWKSAQGRNCKITDKKMVFTAPSTPKNRKTIASLEASFSRFFARWSFSYRPVFSETADKLKLVIDFVFDPERQPITPVVPKDTKREYELITGFSKIKLTFYDKGSDVNIRGTVAPLVHLEVFTQTGTAWYLVHSATVKPEQLGSDVRKFAAGYNELLNKVLANESRT